MTLSFFSNLYSYTVCDPRLSKVFCGYTIHSVGSQTVEPDVTPGFLTSVYSFVKPSPTDQLEPGSSPIIPNTSMISPFLVIANASSPLKNTTASPSA